MTLTLLGDYCKPQHRVTSIATAFGPPNFQMEITPCFDFVSVHVCSVHRFWNELALSLKACPH